MRTAGCVYAEDEADLLLAAAESPAALAHLTDRRVAGEPLEYLLGWAEFCGLRIAVDPGVFVPRGRTALLVEAAAALTGPAPAVADLCCGSGATTVALAHRLAPRWLAAADIDPAAVACARRNLAGLAAEVFEGDLFTPLPPHWRGRLDLVVANAPYVPTAAVALMPPRRGCTRPRWRSTAARTGSTCYAVWRSARPGGWRPLGTSSWRSATHRWARSAPRSTRSGWCRPCGTTRTWTPPR
ncbi:putative protein N(5)-glutamine methyltransferase [Micromonospora vulcania]